MKKIHINACLYDNHDVDCQKNGKCTNREGRKIVAEGCPYRVFPDIDCGSECEDCIQGLCNNPSEGITCKDRS